ncbi:junctional adhesion molecule A-like [Antedon mediterranea]|uniref:junctional adhesion molecule A-like n=1 Tax=Antedon mediterranea TaxID=105859 RepID=UPI003AF8C41E
MEGKCKSALILLIFQLCGCMGQSINKLTAESQVAIEGQDAITLPCYYIPTNAVIGKYYWKKNETVIATKDDSDAASRYSLSDPKQFDTAGYVSLTITNVSRRDADSYTCGVNDESTGATILFQTKCTLTVYYLENPILNPTQLFTNIGETATFTCTEPDGLLPINITWTKDDVMIDYSDTQKYRFFYATLTINRVDEEDEGVYQCKAENAAYHGMQGKLSNNVTLITLGSTSTGLVVGMTFVDVLIGFIICLLVDFIISKI